MSKYATIKTITQTVVFAKQKFKKLLSNYDVILTVDNTNFLE